MDRRLDPDERSLDPDERDEWDERDEDYSGSFDDSLEGSRPESPASSSGSYDSRVRRQTAGEEGWKDGCTAVV